MYKYITLNNNGKYFRILKVEEANDESFYIRQLYHLNAYVSFHSNKGALTPPFRTHHRGANGKIITASIDENRKKFIKDYRGKFCSFGFNGIPTQEEITQTNSHDEVFNVNLGKESRFSINFYSENGTLDPPDYKTVYITNIKLQKNNYIIYLSTE